LIGDGDELGRLDRELHDPTLDSLGVPTSTIEAVRLVVEGRRGVVVVVGESSDVVFGIHALCNLEPLKEADVALLSLSGTVGPNHVFRTGSDDAPEASSSQRFRDAMMSGFDAVVLSEMFDLAAGQALFEERQGGPFVAVGLHARNATAGLIRLLDNGIPEASLAERLSGILAVRLVARLCQSCRKGRAPTAEESAALEPVGPAPVTVWDAPGCEACEGSGAQGQVAVTEWLEVTPSVRDRLGQSEEALRRAAFPGGAGALGTDGLRLLGQGLLSVREWIRLAASYE